LGRRVDRRSLRERRAVGNESTPQTRSVVATSAECRQTGGPAEPRRINDLLGSLTSVDRLDPETGRLARAEIELLFTSLHLGDQIVFREGDLDFAASELSTQRPDEQSLAWDPRCGNYALVDHRSVDSRERACGDGLERSSHVERCVDSARR
jgi:hypothetical protein